MFVCCPEKEAKKRMNKLNDLKTLIETIAEKMVVPCSLVPPCCPPPCPPCCPPPCCPNNVPECDTSKEPSPPPQPPKIMVCYRNEKLEKKRNGRAAKKNTPVRTKRAKSRELRASNLYVGCDCEKRNGLQDDCQRADCLGSPECLTKPDPTCGPSEFCNGKHLYKKFALGLDKDGYGDGNANGDDEAGGRVMVYYNCYPAAIKC